MFAICLLLLTSWLMSVLLGFTLGGVTHLLAVTAAWIVFTDGDRTGVKRAPRGA